MSTVRNSGEVIVLDEDTGRYFAFQYRPHGARRSFVHTIDRARPRGSLQPTLEVLSSEEGPWTVPGWLYAPGADDRAEEHVEDLIALWRINPTTGRPPTVTLTGLGRRAYRGIVEAVDRVVFDELDGANRPRIVTFELRFAEEGSPPSVSAGFPVVGVVR